MMLMINDADDDDADVDDDDDGDNHHKHDDHVNDDLTKKTTDNAYRQIIVMMRSESHWFN